jgi:hypothetical protein
VEGAVAVDLRAEGGFTRARGGARTAGALRRRRRAAVPCAARLAEEAVFVGRFVSDSTRAAVGCGRDGGSGRGADLRVVAVVVRLAAGDEAQRAGRARRGGRSGPGRRAGAQPWVRGGGRRRNGKEVGVLLRRDCSPRRKAADFTLISTAPEWYFEAKGGKPAARKVRMSFNLRSCTIWSGDDGWLASLIIKSASCFFASFNCDLSALTWESSAKSEKGT